MLGDFQILKNFELVPLFKGILVLGIPIQCTTSIMNFDTVASKQELKKKSNHGILIPIYFQKNAPFNIPET